MDDGYFSSPWTRATTYLESMLDSKVLSNSSGFFWAHGDRTFLLTNWHVLSGRNALSGQPMAPHAGVPNRISFFSYRPIDGSETRNAYKVSYVSKLLTLEDLRTGQPRWLEHPTFGSRVDVAALDVTEAVADLDFVCANRLEGDRSTAFDAGAEVFILGFPFGRIPGASAPIWKRGNVALDPTVNPEGLPKMLVDTATREGMSGSLVLTLLPVPEHDIRRADDTRPVYISRFPTVIGVYSGRHYPDLERAQLGIVWKRNTIEEIVATGVPPRF
jgi:hypothetical protein